MLPGGVLWVDHLTAKVPEEEMSDSLVAKGSLQQETSKQAVVMRLKLQRLKTISQGVIINSVN